MAASSGCELVFRPLKEEEFSLAAELIAQNLRKTQDEIPLKAKEAFIKQFFQVENFKSWHSEHMFCISCGVFTPDGNLVGTGSMRDDEEGSGEIVALFSHVDYLGKKISSKILMFLIQEGKKAGFEHIYTHSSEKTRPFFEHFGFEYLNEVEGMSFLKRMRVSTKKVKARRFTQVVEIPENLLKEDKS